MITVSLSDGRELVLNPVTPHEAMSIAEGCRNLSGVKQWWRMAMTISSIRSIDGIPLPLPTHEKHVEGMFSRFSKQDIQVISETLEKCTFEETDLVLELVELTPLETLRLWSVIGEYETIAGWVAPAFIAANVRKIGDEKVSFPTSKTEIKALVEQLGLAGMSKASVFRLAQNAAAKVADAGKRATSKN